MSVSVGSTSAAEMSENGVEKYDEEEPIINDDNEEANDLDDEIPVDPEYEDRDYPSDEEFGFSEEVLGDEMYARTEFDTDPDITNKEHVSMIYLRRFLDQLSEKVAEKEYKVKKTREELAKCKEKILQLLDEEEATVKEAQIASDTSNNSAVYRLRSQLHRVVQELAAEREIEAKIRKRLDEAEYDLAKCHVEQGHYLLMEDDLKKKEAALLRKKTDIAEERLEKEEKYAIQAEMKYNADKETELMKMKDTVERKQYEDEQAENSLKRASKFLKGTHSKIKKEERNARKQHKADLEKKIHSVLTLKNNISQNRENLRAIQARDRAFANEQKAMEEKVRQSIVDTGGNAEQKMLMQKRIDRFEGEKRQFLAKQREGEVTIASKILLEEERMKKRIEQQPYLYPNYSPKLLPPRKKRKLKTLKKIQQGEAEPEPPVLRPYDEIKESESSEEEAPVDKTSTGSVIMSAVLAESDDEGGSRQGTLAQPEFEGMWDKHRTYKVEKDEDSTKSQALPQGTKMDKEILATVLEKHRAGIVKKQVAAGKEFKGVGFYSKPDIIHFKDFVVDKTYKKKVVLTNVSYSVNYCKLIDISEHLKDFVTIDFNPPGQMSAGLTCDMFVTFKPRINEDLDGEVMFIAQTGPFSIPLKCSTKKCVLSVDISTVPFGTSVIGETLTRQVTLTNKGALGTNFDFYKVSGLKNRTITSATSSLGRATLSDIDRPESETTDQQTIQVEKQKSLLKQESQVKSETEGQPEETQEPVEGENVPDEEDVEEGSPPLSPDNMMDDLEDLSNLDGMKVTGGTSGFIGPFESVKLTITWSPRIPGKVETDFSLSFSDPLSENINLMSIANAIDVPVWVQRQNVDLKICMLDRLYQDTIVVNNRAKTALRLNFEVCKELKNYVELLPKTGYIQEQSQFSAQLKFIPRANIYQECAKYIDPETGVLEAPMLIRVADQTRPVPFTVHAIVTSSDLEFNTTNVDFGHCTIYESVKTTVQFTNHSILPQKFGFIGLPEYVDVQPNDGFGTLLPNETIDLEIIFSPKKAKNYSFDLTCKSLINREFKIHCSGVAVHPPLELSNQIIHFRSTAVNDFSTSVFHVINSHTSTNEFTHPVPRIGSGEIAPVGPTSFEFVLPENSPLSISPTVGTVNPGEKCPIRLTFSPKITDAAIREEAVSVAKKKLEAVAEEEFRAAIQREKDKEAEAQKPGKKGGSGKKKPASPKGKSKPGPSLQDLELQGPEPVTAPDPETIENTSDEYCQAHGALLRQFQNEFNTFTIPCYVASGKCAKPNELDYSVHNTLYMHVHCPTSRPELVVISDSARTITDFGDVSKGQKLVKAVTIQNISNRTLNLSANALNSSGPFNLLNALRELPPEKTHTLVLSFTPEENKVYQETLDIRTPYSSLHVTLRGRGVAPSVKLSVEGVLDMGAVISQEYIERTFTINNTSTLAVDYGIQLDSNSLLRNKKAQRIPEFVDTEQEELYIVGTQNYNGKCVFDCVPAEGQIPAGESIEVTVTFAPDHESILYSDGLRLKLFAQEESHYLKLIGAASNHIMFMTGGDALQPSIESLAAVPEAGEAEEGPIPLLCTIRCQVTEESVTPGEGEVYVNCVRTMAVSQKKNGEFVLDNPASINSKGFQVEPQRGMIEAGTKKPIVFTWSPPSGHDTSKPMETSIICTVKGDVTTQYSILLRGICVS